MDDTDEKKEKVNAIISVLSESLKGTTHFKIQTWASFIASIGLTVYGIGKMNITTEKKGFIAMGVLFVTSGAFTLAKEIRDVTESKKWSFLVKKGILGLTMDSNSFLINTMHGLHSSSWFIHWIAFLLALGFTIYGIWRMDLSMEKRGFLAMGVLFVLNSTFHLYKVLRDKAEAEKLLQILTMEKPSQEVEEDG